VTRRRFPIGAARIAGAALLAAVAVLPAFLYEFAISISAGLCGDNASGWITAVAVAVPLLVVGSWGLLHANWIFVAWPAAVLAAAACLMLADYEQTGAHGHCETMTPYSRIDLGLSRYSTMSSEILSPSRPNVTQSADSSSTRQPVSLRL
jgi:hypothetical protein